MSTTVDIAAPVEVVWDIITDLDGSQDVISGILGIERLGGPDGYAVGTRWRETRKMFGKEATEDMEVATVEPMSATTITASSHGSDYLSGFTLESSAAGTTLTMDFTGMMNAEASGSSKLMARLMGPLGASATRKAMQTDLEEIKAEAERRALATS